MEVKNQESNQERILISAERFLEIWLGFIEPEKNYDEYVEFVNHPDGSFIVSFSNIQITDEIVIENHHRKKLPNLELKNCNLGDFELLNSTAKSFIIRSCTFQHFILESSETSHFRISNSEIQKVLVHKSSETNSFQIYNSKIGEFGITQNSKCGGFLIANESKIGDFTVESSILGDFKIWQKSEVKDFRIWDKSTLKSFEASYGTLRNIDILRSHAGHFNLLDSNFSKFHSRKSVLGNIKLFRTKALGIFITASIISELDINDFSSVEKLKIRSDSKLRLVTILDSSVQKIEISSIELISSFRCSFLINQPSIINIEYSKFGSIDIFQSVMSEENIFTISSCEVNRFSINGSSNLGSIFISDLKPLNSWEDFKMEAGNYVVKNNEFQFFNVQQKSAIRFISSDLGKFQILNCKLNNFDDFEFLNSKMLGIFSGGSKMPEKNQFVSHGLKFIDLNEQKRLAFGQFKKIYENQGDRASSLQYLALEMEAYRDQLREEGRWKNRGELFMLWMNKNSTNFGTSWSRGLLSTFLALVFFYSVFNMILYKFQIQEMLDFSCKGWTEFGRIISYAPYYLNPFRDNDSIFVINEEGLDALKQWGSLARIWDFISRIFLTYLVYQTVQAFRKLGKSSG